MESSGSAKLRVKVGAAEFEAEGPADLIREQYQAFLQALQTSAFVPKAPDAGTPSGGASNGDAQKEPSSSAADVTPEAPQPDLDRAILKRVFADKGSLISLLALPKGDAAQADALLLLLYGYSQLRQNDYPITGVRLMQAAKQSGLHQVDRIDRTIGAHQRYVLAAGARRGRKYSLNNQGVVKAQQIIKEILG